MISTPVDYPDQPDWSANAVDFLRDLDGTGTFEWIGREYVRGIRPEDAETAEETARADGVTLVGADAYDDVFDDRSTYERALVWEDTGYFDVNDFLATMRRENVRRGVEFRPDTTVESVLVENGAAVGVETEYGTVDADSIVVAAGSATRALLADVLPLPIRKFTWNVAYLDAGLSEDYPMGGDPEIGAYWRRTGDDHLLVGVEHRYETEPSEGDEEKLGDRLDALLSDDLPNLLAGIDPTTDVVRYEVCPMADATTPDAKAIIDAPAEGPDGVVVAAGFHGAGVMAADSIGVAVRAHLTGEEAPFRLDRFDTRGTDFRFHTMFQT